MYGFDGGSCTAVGVEEGIIEEGAFPVLSSVPLLVHGVAIGLVLM